MSITSRGYRRRNKEQEQEYIENYNPVTVDQRDTGFIVIDKSSGIKQQHAARMKLIDLVKSVWIMVIKGVCLAT